MIIKSAVFAMGRNRRLYVTGEILLKANLMSRETLKIENFSIKMQIHCTIKMEERFNILYQNQLWDLFFCQYMGGKFHKFNEIILRFFSALKCNIIIFSKIKIEKCLRHVGGECSLKSSVCLLVENIFIMSSHMFEMRFL